MKFNVMKKSANKTRNYEGSVAYRITPELELYTAVVTASLSRNFYKGADDRLKRIRKLIQKVDPVFVARLAVYTRTAMHLRSIPLVLTVELSKIHNGDDLVAKTAAAVIQRADEITELLAYYAMANDRQGTKTLNRLSKQLQRGIGKAFNRFDEYQFAKYNRKTAVALKDALFLTHPKAESVAQQVLFDKIAEDRLEVPYTWEVELSAIGQQSFETDVLKKAAFQAKWEELVASNKLGYMALLRNLRNLLDYEVDALTIEKVGARLADPAAVKKSKQMPFRYLAAYREIESYTSGEAAFLRESLEKAAAASASNIDGFTVQTRVLIAADVSGSMYQAISPRSKIRCYDIGLLMSMLLRSRSKNVITGIFGNTWKQVALPQTAMLNSTMVLTKIAGQVGYSTNAHAVIDALIQERKVMDKVFVFSDMQVYDAHAGGKSLEASWIRYKKEVAPKAKLYLCDLVGYGTTPLRVTRQDVYLIAGWSDKVFEVLNAIENGGSALKSIWNTEF